MSARRWAIAAACAWAAGGAAAHSASDAYLTLEVSAGAPTVVRGQWDIALRDLDFAFRLDDDGDGAVTWGELRRHQAEIQRYAGARLKLTGDGRACTLAWTQQKVANHADGAYAALFFESRCAGAPARLTLTYSLFFDIDPSHRAIVVSRTRADTATAVLAPGNATIDLAVKARAGAPWPASSPH
jgi:hypothetical protein